MAKLDEGFEEVPLELDSGFEEQPLELDAGFEETSSLNQEDPIGPVEATTRAVGQGLTFGLADEAAGGLMAAADVATSDSELKDLPKLYKAYRDLQRERDAQASKEFPKTSLVGEVGGSIPTAFTGLGTANTASKAAKLGALMGFGKGEGSVSEQALSTATGAVTGGALHKGSEVISGLLTKLGIGKPLKSLGDSMQTQAEDVALSTLGTNKRTLQSEVGQSIFTPADYRKGIGEEALKMRGVLDAPVDVKVKAAQEIGKLEELKKPLLEQAQQGIKGKVSTSDISSLQEGSLEQGLRNLKDQMINRETQTATNLSSVQNLDTQLEDTIRRYATNDNDIFKLNDFKKLLGEKLQDSSFKKSAEELPQEAEFIRKAYSLVKTRIEDLAEKVEPGLGKRIKEINARENNLYDLGNVARDAQIREIGRSSKWSPAEIIGDQLDKAKIASAKTLNWSGKQLSDVGQTIESPSMVNAISRPIVEEGKQEIQSSIEDSPKKLSQNLYTASDDELMSVADTLENSKQYSIYGQSLKKSLQDGSSDKKNAALFSILQNPNMRKLIYPEAEGQK